MPTDLRLPTRRILSSGAVAAAAAVVLVGGLASGVPAAVGSETPTTTTTTTTVVTSAVPTTTTADPARLTSVADVVTTTPSSTTPPPTTSSSSTTAPGTLSTTAPATVTTSSATTRPGTATSSSGTPVPTSTTPPPGGGDYGLTADEAAAQVAAGQRLLADLRRSNAALAAALDRMDRLAKQSNSLLQRLATARRTLALAQADAERNEELSRQLATRLDRAVRQLKDWAFFAYTQGGSMAELEGVIDSLGQDPARAGNPMGDLVYVSNERSGLVDLVTRLGSEQATATEAAREARATADAAARSIAADKSRLDVAVRAQKAELEGLRRSQAAQLSSAGPLVALLVGLQTPQARDTYDALRAELARAGQDPGAIGAACSHDEGLYPNGLLPAGALCPLWKAPGEALRPSAAAAFDALSQAYARVTGSPICVTDSYRSLAEQYAVKALRGGWAATPGTSPHGLGVALDLCGGIEAFGTPQHLWMQQNAPLYGWYHPSWAEPGGALPEPWHWEFAG